MNTTNDNSASSITITTSSTAQYLVVYYYLNGTDTLTEQEILNSIMINLGSTALPYEPYGTGQWCKYNAIGKVVLDGSETSGWDGTTGDNNKLFRYALINDSGKKGNQSIGYCNYFRCLYGNVIGNYYFNTTLPCKVCFCVSNDYTLDTFKAWLSTHNTIVYYPLATPQIITLPTTLQSQIEDIYNQALAYQGQTNISQVNNDLAFIVESSALKDLSDYENSL